MNFPSAAGLVGLIVSVLNMSEHEFKFLVSVSHSTINVMDWRIFPSAYGHIYKKLIMEQPIIITPPVGTIRQNECLSFCSQKKVFWRPVWFKLFCTSAEPAVTLLSVWRCRNLASFYLPLHETPVCGNSLYVLGKSSLHSEPLPWQLAIFFFSFVSN